MLISHFVWYLHKMQNNVLYSWLTQLALTQFMCSFSFFLNLNSYRISVISGQSKYTELTQATNMPKYGSCWMKALSQLQSTCDQLSDGSHSRLALQFANCLLAQTGQKTYPCDESDDISKCLENVDTNAWTSYSNFFTHTHNMCHFLKSQQWQAELVTGYLN